MSSTEKDDISHVCLNFHEGWRMSLSGNLWKQTWIIIVIKLTVATDNQCKTFMIGTFMPCERRKTLCVLRAFLHNIRFIDLTVMWRQSRSEEKKKERVSLYNSRSSYVHRVWRKKNLNDRKIQFWIELAYLTTRNIA